MRSAYRTLIGILSLGLLLPVWPAAVRAQELTFEFQVVIGGVASDWHAFGLREDAAAGMDAYDLPEPPPPPGATFRAYLAMFEPLPGLPNQWLREFRPVGGVTDGRVELWQVVIESADPGATGGISVRAPMPPGVPYDLYFISDSGDRQLLPMPAFVWFPITAPQATHFFELRFGGSVASAATTWGGVKSLFR